MTRTEKSEKIYERKWQRKRPKKREDAINSERKKETGVKNRKRGRCDEAGEMQEEQEEKQQQWPQVEHEWGQGTGGRAMEEAGWGGKRGR